MIAAVLIAQAVTLAAWWPLLRAAGRGDRACNVKTDM